MDEREQMLRAVNDMKIRFSDIRGNVSNGFFSSRLDTSNFNGLNSYNIPLITDLLFSGGIYKRNEVAGLEVLDAPDGATRSGGSSYGARTFVKLKSPNGRVLGRARITFDYKAEVLGYSVLGRSVLQREDPEPLNQKDDFNRRMDYLKIKHVDEAAVYQIGLFQIRKIKPDTEIISELLDEQREPMAKYLMFKEYGANINYLDKLPNPNSVINYFKKIWMLE